MVGTLAHISDLHFGAGRGNLRRAEALCRTLEACGVDHIVLTGDVTHRGRQSEYASFLSTFRPLLSTGKLTVVPGNHDRLGDDVGKFMQGNRRVTVVEHPGLYLVAVDSTAEHNRYLISGHGQLDTRDLDEIDAALARAPADRLRVVAMHHHPLPLREEQFVERFASFVGWPYATELSSGPQLLARLRGRCDLLLHGHRHVPNHAILAGDDLSPLHVINAGSSVETSKLRVLAHHDGQVCGSPIWLQTHEEDAEHRIASLKRQQTDLSRREGSSSRSSAPTAH